MTNHPDGWTSDQAYEPYVGRWSRLVAPRFLQRLPPAPPSASWCDVDNSIAAVAVALSVDPGDTRAVLVDTDTDPLPAWRSPTYTATWSLMESAQSSYTCPTHSTVTG
jgi:hypothetical protein